MPTADSGSDIAPPTTIEPIVAPLPYASVTDADVGGRPQFRVSGCAIGLGLGFSFIGLGFIPLLTSATVVVISALILILVTTVAGVSRYEYRSALAEHERKVRAEEARRREAARQAAALITAELRLELHDIPAAATQARLNHGNAVSALAHARREFTAKAYASFWDAIFCCHDQLRSSSATVTDIAQRVRRYHERLAGRTHTFPLMLIAPSDLPALASPAHELSQLAREGETDFQFATILEHKKTRDVLISGFSSVGAAIDDLGMRIEGALDAVRNELVVAQEQGAATAARLQMSVDSIAANTAASAETDRRVSAVIDKYRLLDE